MWNFEKRKNKLNKQKNWKSTGSMIEFVRLKPEVDFCRDFPSQVKNYNPEFRENFNSDLCDFGIFPKKNPSQTYLCQGLTPRFPDVTTRMVPNWYAKLAYFFKTWFYIYLGFWLLLYQFIGLVPFGPSGLAWITVRKNSPWSNGTQSQLFDITRF